MKKKIIFILMLLLNVQLTKSINNDLKNSIVYGITGAVVGTVIPLFKGEISFRTAGQVITTPLGGLIAYHFRNKISANNYVQLGSIAGCAALGGVIARLICIEWFNGSASVSDE